MDDLRQERPGINNYLISMNAGRLLWLESRESCSNCYYFDEYDHDLGHEWFCTHDSVTRELDEHRYEEIETYSCEHYKLKEK